MSEMSYLKGLHASLQIEGKIAALLNDSILWCLNYYQNEVQRLSYDRLCDHQRKFWPDVVPPPLGLISIWKMFGSVGATQCHNLFCQKWISLSLWQSSYHLSLTVCSRAHTMPKKKPPKWQKNDLVSGGHGPQWSWRLAWTMNWVDRLRTSADKRMWS